MGELRAACYGRDLEREGWPTVSVVMPIRNEAEHLETAVKSVLEQEYPIPFDVCLAIAPSDDGTEQTAARLAAADARVTTVPNRAGVTPAGLNAAIAATTGDVVVRVDGHSNLSEGYIKQAVKTMARTGAVNVGGMQVPEPHSPFEEAVADATTSWLGTGGATYRMGGRAGPVDTVYLGVFDRAAGDRVGWFDEALIRNQDYELNIRLRKAGGEVWFDPELSVGYRPRGSWTTLAKQYYEYGWWKAEVLRRHPDSLRLRQFAPVAVIGALTAMLVASLCRRAFIIGPLLYAITLAFSARKSPRRTTVAGVLATSHVAWSSGVAAGFRRRSCQ